jgi:uncharacterized protein YkwD
VTLTSERRRGALASLVSLVVVAVLSASLVAASPVAAATSGLITNEINKERASVGLPALRESSALDLAAARHNACMARYNTLSHWITQCETSLGTRVTAAGFRWTVLSENVAVTTSWPVGSLAILNMQKLMWREGPGGGHYQNIVSSKVTYVGNDVYIDYTHHKAWLTEIFAHQ